VSRVRVVVTLDDKGRLVMPSRCQPVFDIKRDKKDQEESGAEPKDEDGKKVKGKIVIAPDADEMRQCLLIYTLDKWAEVEQRLEKLPSKNKDCQDIKTLIDLSVTVDLDNKGRFIVPSDLLKHIGLNMKDLPASKFYLLGPQDKLQLWKKEVWDEEYRRANEALMAKKEGFRQLQEAKQTVEKARQARDKAIQKEVLDEILKETQESKQAIKQAMKEALLAELAGQGNNPWEEQSSGLQDFKM